MGTPRSDKRVANSLLALSSAAVLGVYAAGYARTRAAADRVAQSEARRVEVSVHRLEAAASGVTPVTPQPVPALPRKAIDGGAAQERKRLARKRSPEATTANPVAHVTPGIAVTPHAAPPPSGPAAPVAPAPSAPAAPAPSAPDAPSAPPAPGASPLYRDGTYYGWGTSRHGDIQAAVVIENGRIASATIAQCLTRYSCSVIAKLPPEVSERQSPEVDYVSGATQSTNAFYYAVVEALGQAKAK